MVRMEREEEVWRQGAERDKVRGTHLQSTEHLKMALLAHGKPAAMQLPFAGMGGACGSLPYRPYEPVHDEFV